MKAKNSLPPRRESAELLGGGVGEDFGGDSAEGAICGDHHVWIGGIEQFLERRYGGPSRCAKFLQCQSYHCLDLRPRILESLDQCRHDKFRLQLQYSKCGGGGTSNFEVSVLEAINYDRQSRSRGVPHKPEGVDGNFSQRVLAIGDNVDEWRKCVCCSYQRKRPNRPLRNVSCFRLVRQARQFRDCWVGFWTKRLESERREAGAIDSRRIKNILSQSPTHSCTQLRFPIWFWFFVLKPFNKVGNRIGTYLLNCLRYSLPGFISLGTIIRGTSEDEIGQRLSIVSGFSIASNNPGQRAHCNRAGKGDENFAAVPHGWRVA